MAADGIDEFLDVFLPTDLADHPNANLGGTLQLRATGQAATWLVTVQVGILAVRRDLDPDPADAPLVTVTAAASDLLLLLWKRIPLSAPEIAVSGEQAVLARFAALTDLD